MLILCLPLAWLLVSNRFGMYAIGFSIILTGVANSVSRVWFSRKLVGMSAKKWFFDTIVPITLVSVFCLSAGILTASVITPSAFRVCVTTVTVDVLFLSLVWMFVLKGNERALSKKIMKKVIGR